LGLSLTRSHRSQPVGLGSVKNRRSELPLLQAVTDRSSHEMSDPRNCQLMPNIKEINRIDELAEYRSAWQSLLSETVGATFFQSLDWLESYWTHFGERRKLRVLIVSGQHGPIGIVPLAVSREATKVGSIRVLTYPLHDWGSFYGPIGPDPANTLKAALAHVSRCRPDWDMMELRWGHPEDADAGRTERAMREAGLQAYKTVWNRTAMIDIEGTWDEYLAGRSKKWQRNIRHWGRKLAEQGQVTHVRYRPKGKAFGEDDPRWDLYDSCEDISRKSWQGSSVTGTTLSHESVRPFLRDVHARAAKRGALDMNLLYVDGKPAAFAYNYHFEGSIYGLRAGYDARLSKAGLGNVLYARTIEDSFQRGDHTYDLGVGSLDVKKRFLNCIVPIFRYSHFRVASPVAQLLRTKRWLQHRALDRQESLALTGDA
jgi:CelD/BcsL family acetyltransferase involved in cellulose biosynthesis